MFPVDKCYFQKFNIDSGDTYSQMLMNILTKNQPNIVQQAQKYLTNYENGARCMMASKIDEIIAVLDCENDDS